MREEINLYNEINKINKDHINTIKNIMDKLSGERVTTETYRESLKMLDSLYQERLSSKKSLNRDEKIDIILDGMD
jgi:hypothetical protein